MSQVFEEVLVDFLLGFVHDFRFVFDVFAHLVLNFLGVLFDAVEVLLLCAFLVGDLFSRLAEQYFGLLVVFDAFVGFLLLLLVHLFLQLVLDHDVLIQYAVFAVVFLGYVPFLLLGLQGQESAFLLELLVALVLDDGVGHLAHLGLDLVESGFELEFALALHALLVVHHLLDDLLVAFLLLQALLLDHLQPLVVVLQNAFVLLPLAQALLDDGLVLLADFVVYLFELLAILIDFVLLFFVEDILALPDGLFSQLLLVEHLAFAGHHV